MSKAIFLGSFNPPHQGHYNAIKQVIDSGIMSELKIEKIHIIPCYQNPNKDKQIHYWDRYEMTKLIFDDLIKRNKVYVDDIEADRCPHYTYELIEYFKTDVDEFIQHDFWWIITYETIQELLDNKWFKSEDLLKDNKFIILIKNEFEKNEILRDINNINLKFIQIDPLPIHSTQLRENLDKYSSFLNQKTLNYILKNKLYS